MINRSSWIQLGAMPQHLARTDTNKRVEVVAAAGRATMADIDLDLSLFEEISLTNRRVERTLIHVRIAPEKPVSDAQLLHLLELNEQIHGIPSDQPRIVVRHSKGDRADHFHVLWPTVRTDGTSVRSHGNYLRDEIISREAELVLGERFIPGPRMPMVIAHFRQSGRDQEADTLEQAPKRDRRSRLGDKSYNMAARSETDIASFQANVLDAWQEHHAGQDFAEALGRRGLRLALGAGTKKRRSIVLVVEDATGFHASLRRTINAAAKARRLSLYVTADQVPASAGLPALELAREAGFKDALERAVDAHRREKKLLVAERDEDRDPGPVEARETTLLPPVEFTFKQTLKARRGAIKEHYRIRDQLRQQRVDRAFAAAGIFCDRRLRRIVFAAAAAGVLLSGGGLGLALIAGGVARTLLPSRERARALAKASGIERQRDRETQALELHHAYARVRQEFRGQERRIAPVRVFVREHRGKAPGAPAAQVPAVAAATSRRGVHPLSIPPSEPRPVTDQAMASPGEPAALSPSPESKRPSPESKRPPAPSKTAVSAPKSAPLHQIHAPAVPASGISRTAEAVKKPRILPALKPTAAKAKNKGISR
ncbi:MAG: hypothetical protein LCH88_00060 [Proteobacteria bacterium]|nr:hypothetical protein [Pseudomonadota bacterium]